MTLGVSQTPVQILRRIFYFCRRCPASLLPRHEDCFLAGHGGRGHGDCLGGAGRLTRQRFLVKKKACWACNGRVAAAVAAAEGRAGRAGGGGGWRRCRCLQGLLPGLVLQRFCEADLRRQGGVQGSTALRGAEPRGALRRSDVGLVAPFSDVLKLGKPGHYFYELLFWWTPALVSCDSLRWCLKELLVVFYMKVRTNPGDDFACTCDEWIHGAQYFAVDLDGALVATLLEVEQEIAVPTICWSARTMLGDVQSGGAAVGRVPSRESIQLRQVARFASAASLEANRVLAAPLQLEGLRSEGPGGEVRRAHGGPGSGRGAHARRRDGGPFPDGELCGLASRLVPEEDFLAKNTPVPIQAC